jgi:NitT/TauT family transport system substrate-binding protein
MRLLKSLIAITLVTLTMLSGCKPSGPSSSSGPTTVKVGYIPIVDCLPLYVAKDKGFLDKQGLSAELMPLQGGPRIIEALTSKSIDIGYSNMVSNIVAHSKGIPMVGVAGGPVETESRQVHALLVSDSSPIRGPGDLAGKTIAVNALRNIEHVVLRQYLEKNGVDINGVKIVEAPFPQMEGLLKNGSADAVMAVEPFITLAVAHKSARVLARPYTEVRSRNIVANYNVRREWFDQNAETARKFAAALAEANAFISSNEAEARQILVKYTQIPQEVIGAVVLPQSLDKFDESDVQVWVDELAKQGLIEKAFPAGEILRQQ